MLSKIFEDVKGADAIDTFEMPVNQQRGDYCKTHVLKLQNIFLFLYIYAVHFVHHH